MLEELSQFHEAIGPADLHKESTKSEDMSSIEDKIRNILLVIQTLKKKISYHSTFQCFQFSYCIDIGTGSLSY